MSANDPRQAIINQLCAPAGTLPDRRTTPRDRQNITTIDGWPAQAQPESVAFVKQRNGETRTLYAVTYLDTSGGEYLDIVCLRRHTDGSWLIGRAGRRTDSDVPRDQLRVDLSGLWGPELFWAGGRVIGHDARHAQRVRLVFGDGQTLDDRIEDGIVLFLAEHAVQIPATAQIFDTAGDIIATHTTFA